MLGINNPIVRHKLVPTRTPAQCKYLSTSCRATLLSENSNPWRKAFLFRTTACKSTDPNGRLMCNSTVSPTRNSMGNVADTPDSLISIEKPGIGPSLVDRTVTSTSSFVENDPKRRHAISRLYPEMLFRFRNRTNSLGGWSPG